MSKYTENYKLILPEQSEHYDVEVANTNNKEIDRILEDKVDKIPGKGLSTNDFSNEYEQKLSKLQNYDDKEVREAIDSLNTKQSLQSTKVEKIEKDLESIKSKNTEQDKNIADIQTEQATQNADIEELKAENERLKEDLNNSTISASSSGENITIEGSAEARFKKLVVKGNSLQETRESNNLFNPLNLKQNSRITDSDLNTGSFIVKNAWAEDIFNDNNEVYKMLKPNAKYKFLADVTLLEKPEDISNDANSHGHILVLYKLDKTIIPLASMSKEEKDNWNLNEKKHFSTAFTTPKDLTEYSIITYCWYNGSGTGIFKYENVMIIPEIEEDESFKAYGNMPSPEFQSPIRNCGDINFKVINENLLNVPEEFTINGAKIRTKNVPVNMPAGEYTVKATQITTNKATTILIEAYYKDDSGDKNIYISPSEPKTTVNLEKEVDHVLIYSNNIYASSGDTTTTFKQLMIYTGTEDKQYIEHQEQAFSFPTKQGQVFHKGDYLADDGVHQVRKTIELTGEENWAKSVSLNRFYFSFDENSKKAITGGVEILCTHYKRTNDINAEGIFLNNSYFNNDYKLLGIVDNRFTTLEEFTSYLKEQKANDTPVLVEYELEKEEEKEPYSPEQQEAWKEIKNAKTYKGTTHIFCTDEISCEFEEEHIVDLGAYINSKIGKVSADTPIQEQPSMQEGPNMEEPSIEKSYTNIEKETEEVGGEK